MPHVPDTTFTLENVLNDLREAGTEPNRAGMARFGIETDLAFGVPLSVLRPLARSIGPSPTLRGNSGPAAFTKHASWQSF